MVKIILISIIKNEEKIIERCITSVLSICDAVCITDTGSTDNTCTIVENLFKNKNIVGKLYHDEWKDFGHNRTNAFKNAQEYCNKLGWDSKTTYGLLLDADTFDISSPVFDMLVCLFICFFFSNLNYSIIILMKIF
jgi:glycosyltransferase involved in cell wall biosynthesis